MLVPKYPVEPAPYGDVIMVTVPSDTANFAPVMGAVPIPTFWLVSTVIAVVPADWMVNAVDVGLVMVVMVSVEDQDGAAPTPPDTRTLPTATSASRDNVVVPEAYRISPTE